MSDALRSTRLRIIRGQTFAPVIRWSSGPYIYKAITAIAKRAPVRMTVASHDIPSGWKVAVVSVKGMREINDELDENRIPVGFSPGAASGLHKVTVIDADTIDLNDVNSANFTTYTEGGYLQFRTPADLTDFTARMKIKDRVGGTELDELTTENGKIVIDEDAHTITLQLDADVTAAYEWIRAVYDLEMVSPDDVVTKLLRGPVEVTQEVTDD